MPGGFRGHDGLNLNQENSEAIYLKLKMTL